MNICGSVRAGKNWPVPFSGAKATEFFTVISGRGMAVKSISFVAIAIPSSSSRLKRALEKILDGPLKRSMLRNAN